MTTPTIGVIVRESERSVSDIGVETCDDWFSRANVPDEKAAKSNILNDSRTIPKRVDIDAQSLKHRYKHVT